MSVLLNYMPCITSISMPGDQGIQKSTSNSLKLDLCMVVNHLVGDGSQTWVACKSNKWP